MKNLFLGLAALLALASCTNASDSKSYKSDAPVMPKLEGCTIERHVVTIAGGLGLSTEVVYVARCQPLTTSSTSTTRNCGKGCTQRITTITTTEGTPDGSLVQEIPR
jgi:hypothetical protein